MEKAGELNGQAVKLAKVEGEFVWHQHAEADELFYVVEGRLDIEFREESTVTLDDGELLIVPRGVEHKPVAPEGEARIMLFEPSDTRNTGDVESDLTQETAERLE